MPGSVVCCELVFIFMWSILAINSAIAVYWAFFPHSCFRHFYFTCFLASLSSHLSPAILLYVILQLLHFAISQSHQLQFELYNRAKQNSDKHNAISHISFSCSQMKLKREKARQLLSALTLRTLRWIRCDITTIIGKLTVRLVEMSYLDLR